MVVVEVVYPIHAAALNGCPRLLQLMLGAGADPDQKTSFGRKALESSDAPIWMPSCVKKHC